MAHVLRQAGELAWDRTWQSLEDRRRRPTAAQRHRVLFGQQVGSKSVACQLADPCRETQGVIVTASPQAESYCPVFCPA